MTLVREVSLTGQAYIYHNNDGLYYHVSDVSNTAAYMKCIFYERGCLGRGILRVDGTFYHSRSHSHPNDIAYIQELLLRRNILDRAGLRQYVSFRDIVEDERQRFPPDVASRVTYGRMVSQMQNERMGTYPPIPQSIEEFVNILVTPENRSVTASVDETDNLYARSVRDGLGYVHILLLTHRMLCFMAHCTTLFADATFKSTPAVQGMTQVFCISTIWRWHVIPLCWVLMSSKSQESYTSVLLALRDLMGPCMLQTVVTDFETGLQNSWELVFHVAVQGCLFHYCQALIRQACAIGLKNMLQDNHDLRLIFMWCCALPLLPDHLIDLGFFLIGHDTMQAYPHLYPYLRPFLLYLDVEWVHNNARRPHLSVCGSMHRTNNAAESQNRMLFRSVRTAHPNCYVFLMGIANLEQTAYTDLISLSNGRNPSRTRKARYMCNDDHIRRLTGDLVNSPDPIHFAVRRFIRVVCYKLKGLVDRVFDDEQYAAR